MYREGLMSYMTTLWEKRFAREIGKGKTSERLLASMSPAFYEMSIQYVILCHN